MPILDTAAARRELDRLRLELADARLEPGRAKALGRRLSELGYEVACASQAEFDALVEAAAA